MLKWLLKWRRLVLRTFIVIFRAWIQSVEASLIGALPAQGRQKKNANQLTDAQESCVHPRASQYAHGNGHGQGIYCRLCRFRLEWTPSQRPVPLSTAANTLTPTTTRSRTAASSSAAASSSTASSRRVTPGYTAPPKAPPTQFLNQAQEVDDGFQVLPAPIQMIAVPPNVNQNPTPDSFTGDAGVDMEWAQIFCHCGLPMMRDRMQNPHAAHNSRAWLYMWKCARLDQSCRLKIMETTIHEYLLQYPSRHHVMEDPLMNEFWQG
jgi:hypothetical protein